MRLLPTILILSSLGPAAKAQRFELIQDGWLSGARLDVRFTGSDSDRDGAITNWELMDFKAMWSSPSGELTSWALPDIPPDGFFFIDLDNYLLFATNSDFTIVSTAFEGEALASIFDSSLFPVDSTSTPPSATPEPLGTVAFGLIAMRAWRKFRRSESEACN